MCEARNGDVEVGKQFGPFGLWFNYNLKFFAVMVYGCGWLWFVYFRVCLWVVGKSPLVH